MTSLLNIQPNSHAIKPPVWLDLHEEEEDFSEPRDYDEREYLARLAANRLIGRGRKKAAAPKVKKAPAKKTPTKRKPKKAVNKAAPPKKRTKKTTDPIEKIPICREGPVELKINPKSILF